MASVATARGGAALDVTYALASVAPASALKLIGELTSIAGIQSVELKGD